MAVTEGLILSAHDVSEGGLAVTAAEMAFSMKAGVEIEARPTARRPANPGAVERLFGEAPSRILIEVAPADRERGLKKSSPASAFAAVGKTDASHSNLVVRGGGDTLIETPLADLKQRWKHSLTPYY